MYVGNTSCNVSMTLNDNIFHVVGEVKDLGVIVDSHLSFDAHISKTVARAFMRTNLICKCFTQGWLDIYRRYISLKYDWIFWIFSIFSIFIEFLKCFLM